MDVEFDDWEAGGGIFGGREGTEGGSNLGDGGIEGDRRGKG